MFSQYSAGLSFDTLHSVENHAARVQLISLLMKLMHNYPDKKRAIYLQWSNDYGL